MIVDGPIGARGRARSSFLAKYLLMYIKVSPHLANGTLKFTRTFTLDLSFFHKLFKFLKYPAHKGAVIQDKYSSSQVFVIHLSLQFDIFNLIVYPFVL